MNIKVLILKSLLLLGVISYGVYKLAENWYYNRDTDMWVFGWCDATLLFLGVVGVITVSLIIWALLVPVRGPTRAGCGIPCKWTEQPPDDHEISGA